MDEYTLTAYFNGSKGQILEQVKWLLEQMKELAADNEAFCSPIEKDAETHTVLGINYYGYKMELTN